MTKKSVLVVVAVLAAFYYFIFDREFDFNNKFSNSHIGESVMGTYKPPLEEIYGSTFIDAASGESVRLGNLIKGNENVVIHFWGSWCVPCLVEIPSLYRYAESKKDMENPPIFVFIAINDTWSNITKFLEKAKLDYSKVGHWLIDMNSESYTKYRVDKVPESFVIRSGAVERLVGAQVWK